MKAFRLSVVIFLSLLLFPVSVFSNHVIEVSKTPICLKDRDAQKLIDDVEKHLKDGKIIPAPEFDPLKDSSYVKCVDIADEEIKGSAICLFDNQKMMNVAFLRASLFVEIGTGMLTSDEMFGYENIPQDKRTQEENNMSLYMNAVKGHDLQGKDLRKFYDAYLTGDFTEPQGRIASEFAEYEREFLQKILEPRFEVSDENNEFVVIGIYFGEKMCGVFSHEVLHAQFFLNERYRNAVHEYIFDYVDHDDMKTYVTALSSIYTSFRWKPVYRDNEFMAWTLMQGSHNWASQHERLEFRNATPVLDRYRESMRSYLISKGIAPFIVETDCSKWKSNQDKIETGKVWM